MKRSQIALLSVGGVLALAVIASVVSARIAPYRGAPEHVDAQASSGDAGLRGFRAVEVAGRWQVRLNRGDDWRVDLSYPEVLEDRVQVHVIGDRLRLGLESDASWNEAGAPLSADIVMPELEDVEARGAAMIEVSAFRADGSRSTSPAPPGSRDATAATTNWSSPSRVRATSTSAASR